MIGNTAGDVARNRVRARFGGGGVVGPGAMVPSSVHHRLPVFAGHAMHPARPRPGPLVRVPRPRLPPRINVDEELAARGDALTLHDHHPRGGLREGDPDPASVLSNKGTEPPPTLGMTLDAATVRLADALSTEKGRAKAAETMRRAICIAQEMAHADENLTPFRVWAVLDHGLFDGQLTPHVYLGWRGVPHRRPSSKIPGQTLVARNPYAERIAILLNPVFDASRGDGGGGGRRQMRQEEIVACLIHQMLHAWFLVACGKQGNPSATVDERLKHGTHYWAAMYHICDAAKALRSTHTARTFAQVLLDLHALPPDRDGAQPISPPVDGVPDRTVCCRELVQRPDEPAVRAAYAALRAAAASAASPSVHSLDPDSLRASERPRGDHGSAVDYVELGWGGMSFAYGRAKLEADFPALAARFFADGARRLALPAGLDAEAFAALDQFLQRRDYRPPVALPAARGPPVVLVDEVRVLGPQEPNPLLVDVKAYKLGHALPFAELAAHALARLHAPARCAAPPLPVLAEAYDARTNGADGTVPPALREWCRRWMLVARDPATPGFYGSNLAAMERGGAGVQGLCVALGGGRSELALDYQACREALWARTGRKMDEPECEIDGVAPGWWVEGGGGRAQGQGQKQSVSNNVFVGRARRGGRVEVGGDDSDDDDRDDDGDCRRTKDGRTKVICLPRGGRRSPTPPRGCRRKSPGGGRRKVRFILDPCDNGDDWHCWPGGGMFPWDPRI